MNQTHRPAVTVAALALSAGSLLLIPSGAAADTSGRPASKAAIEHAELQAAGVDRPSKAQIEQRERQHGTAGATGSGSQQQPSSPSSSGGTGAAAWQLALSAALGAVLTGGIVVASRQVTHHGRAVAS